MGAEEIFQYFVFFIMPPAVLIIGVIGNSFGLTVLMRKKLKNIGPCNTYKYLFISDMIYLLQLLINYLAYGYEINLQVMSSLACKLTNYFNFTFSGISPWLLVYISVEKFISIIYPTRRFFIRKKKTQLVYFIILLTINFVYYIPISFFFDIISYNQSNVSSLVCTYNSLSSQDIATYLSLLNRTVIPFSLMMLFSFLLIYSIFKSRNRVLSTMSENKRLKRDIRFAFSSFFLNVTFILLNAPTFLVYFVPSFYSHIYVLFTYYILNLSYAVNFYILFITNSLFRKEFFLIFLNPKKKRDVLLKRTNNFVENDEQVNSIWQLFFTVYTFVRFKKSIKVEKVKQ